MDGERVRLRHKNPELQGEWDCPVAAVEAMRGLDWVPVDEQESTESEPVLARRNRRDT